MRTCSASAAGAAAFTRLVPPTHSRTDRMALASYQENHLETLAALAALHRALSAGTVADQKRAHDRYANALEAKRADLAAFYGGKVAKERPSRPSAAPVVNPHTWRRDPEGCTTEEVVGLPQNTKRLLRSACRRCECGMIGSIVYPFWFRSVAGTWGRKTCACAVEPKPTGE